MITYYGKRDCKYGHKKKTSSLQWCQQVAGVTNTKVVGHMSDSTSLNSRCSHNSCCSCNSRCSHSSWKFWVCNLHIATSELSTRVNLCRPTLSCSLTQSYQIGLSGLQFQTPEVSPLLPQWVPFDLPSIQKSHLPDRLLKIVSSFFWTKQSDFFSDFIYLSVT